LNSIDPPQSSPAEAPLDSSDLTEPIPALLHDRVKRARQRVLVVEDDARLRSTLVSFLEDEGYLVAAAANGAEALDLIEQTGADLLLLDMHMPIMDGWKTVQELRSRGVDIPIVVMTAAHDARQLATELGAIAYVPKPLSLPSLIRRLDDISA